VSGVDILAKIDAATAGLCPCGAEPAPGSTYCGDDCQPTHMARDSDDSPAGSHDTATPMRWRPDLVTAADDADLIPLGSTTYYTGRFNAQLFDRRGRRDVWHLRLDDGHRFVGADLEGVGESIDDDLHRRVGETWATLERELGNTRHLVDDDDPWADVMPAHLAEAWATYIRTRDHIAEADRLRQAAWGETWASAFRAIQGAGVSNHTPARGGPIPADVSATRDRPPRHTPSPCSHFPSVQIVVDGSRFHEQINTFIESMQQYGLALTNWQRNMVDQMFHRAVLPTERVQVAGCRPTADPDEPPTDPMARALWLRRRRNTGPGPNRLDGRRGRRP
jgi:hypothetical protein